MVLGVMASWDKACASGKRSWPEIRRGSKVSRVEASDCIKSIFTCLRYEIASAIFSNSLTTADDGSTKLKEPTPSFAKCSTVVPDV